MGNPPGVGVGVLRGMGTGCLFGTCMVPLYPSANTRVPTSTHDSDHCGWENTVQYLSILTKWSFTRLPKGLIITHNGFQKDFLAH